MYLLRLDDAAPNWNAEMWDKMHQLLSKYNISPIFGIIPHNEDSKLLEFPEDEKFLLKIRNWIDIGWTPALHGFSHKYITESGGINPVSCRSEFAGVPLQMQKQKIKDGYNILKEWGIEAKIFFAPSHTFDKNTLFALYDETQIRIVSDTVSNDIYFENNFYFIPQQSGKVRRLKYKVTTFCYHPNYMTDIEFQELEKFLDLYSDKFVSFNDLEFKNRKKSLYDKTLQKMYFLRRKILRLLKSLTFKL